MERGRTDRSRQILEHIELLLRPHVDQQAADAVGPVVGRCIDLRSAATW
jgi:hypothetical protein